jgi:hypothetical protein
MLHLRPSQYKILTLSLKRPGKDRQGQVSALEICTYGE